MSEKNERILGSSDIGTMKVSSSSFADDREKQSMSSVPDWTKTAQPTSTSPNAKPSGYGAQFFYHLTHPALLDTNPKIKTINTSNQTTPASSSSSPFPAPFRNRSSSLPNLGTGPSSRQAPGGRHFTITDEAVKAALMSS